ncbi:thiamine phosphate synthase [Chitinophaga sp.]|uniref:thiamine phosphate synthase n=1 Tax=Chitinophaga sp. TaxID=1869181 RepID=UPI0031DCC090
MIWIVTSPQRVPEETKYLNELAAAGPVTLLLRKPGWELQEYSALLEGLQDHSKVMITGYPELLGRYNVKGFHMSESMREQQPTSPILPARYCNPVLSTSVHTPENPGPAWQYLLLGPVFDSISKKGYSGKAHLFNAVPPNCIAIGGIDASNITRLKAMGFHGAALLGAIWQNPAMAVKNYRIIQTLWDHSQ